jgi:hypothetical protein
MCRIFHVPPETDGWMRDKPGVEAVRNPHNHQLLLRQQARGTGTVFGWQCLVGVYGQSHSEFDQR